MAWGSRGQLPAPPSRGQRAVWGLACVRLLAPGAFPATTWERRPRVREPGQAAAPPRTEHMPPGWERQDILSSAWGVSALPWRWGGCRLQRPQRICAQREAWTESGLERQWDPFIVRVCEGRWRWSWLPWAALGAPALLCEGTHQPREPRGPRTSPCPG